MADKITKETVRHIARLARIKLTPDEEKRYTKELGSIVGYMDVLNELNTDNVQETAQVTGLTNVMFTDQVEKAPCNSDELIALTENEVRNRQVVVKKVF